jgi:hypothetical protein
MESLTEEAFISRGIGVGIYGIRNSISGSLKPGRISNFWKAAGFGYKLGLNLYKAKSVVSY